MSWALIYMIICHLKYSCYRKSFLNQFFRSVEPVKIISRYRLTVYPILVKPRLEQIAVMPSLPHYFLIPGPILDKIRSIRIKEQHKIPLICCTGWWDRSGAFTLANVLSIVLWSAHRYPQTTVCCYAWLPCGPRPSV